MIKNKKELETSINAFFDNMSKYRYRKFQKMLTDATIRRIKYDGEVLTYTDKEMEKENNDYLSKIKKKAKKWNADIILTGILPTLHIEAPDECGHVGDAKLKTRAIADFDA
ncbi:MAG: hypothetical protein HC836_36055, partial [Richelia sp. RM2_1_2]|nr:hypothetical protein [Richelia sp. RM2_1_2]